jgi:hypothetical protein
VLLIKALNWKPASGLQPPPNFQDRILLDFILRRGNTLAVPETSQHFPSKADIENMRESGEQATVAEEESGK